MLENGEISGNGGPPEYLDLACGCSLGPLKAARQIKEQTENPEVHIKCSDIRQDAIEYSKKIADKEGVSHFMGFDVYNISEVDKKEPPE